MTPNCWPSPQQLLLLQAALLELPQASQAWIHYRSQFDLQQIDPVSTTLLPLIYKNISSFGQNNYRHTWISNLHLFSKIRPLLESSPDICLLKGAAMILHYYRDPGLRVMGDIDLLIPRNKAKSMIEELIQAGWSPIKEKIAGSDLDRFIRRSHALMLTDLKGNNLDLHWTLLADSGIDPLFANHTYRTIKISSALIPQATILSPEDQLLHTLFHGLKYSPQSLIRWIPDAAYILKQTPHFDWNYFFSQAKKIGIEWTIHQALRYLHNHSFASIPLHDYRPTRQEQRYFRFLTKKRGLFSTFLSYWHSHLRNTSAPLPLFTFPQYLKKVTQQPTWRQFFFFLCRKL